MSLLRNGNGDECPPGSEIATQVLQNLQHTIARYHRDGHGTGHLTSKHGTSPSFRLGPHYFVF